MKIARIVTIPMAFVHIKKQIRHLVKNGHDVTLVSSAGDYQDVVKAETGAKIYSHEIPRNINIFADLFSLIRLFLYFKRENFDIAHSSTPKAGLLTALAAYVASVPIRLHTFTGQRWATLRGPARSLLKFLDRLICILNTHVYADSPSQVEFLINQGICSRNKISCLGKGSYGGIDTEKFNMRVIEANRKPVRDKLGIKENEVLLGFVGRIGKDKGIEELFEAFKRADGNYLHLLLVGPLEGTPEENTKWEKQIEENDHIHHIGFNPTPEKYMAAMDIFCLPSYREGFGTVILETAVMGIPSIGTRIPGLVDSIEDGVTGVLVEKQNADELYSAMVDLAEDTFKRHQMGEKARERTLREFDGDKLSVLLINEYQRLSSL